MISCMISLMISQVADAEAALKMKIRPVNAFFKCYNFAYLFGVQESFFHPFQLFFFHFFLKDPKL